MYLILVSERHSVIEQKASFGNKYLGFSHGFGGSGSGIQWVIVPNKYPLFSLLNDWDWSNQVA